MPLPLAALSVALTALPLRISLGMPVPLTMLARRRLFLPLPRTRMLVATALAAAGEAFNAGDVIGHRGDVRRMHVGRFRAFGDQLIEQLLQLGQGLRAGRSGAALFFCFLPMHFDERNGIDHFITDFPSGHSISFPRAFNRKSTASLRVLGRSRPRLLHRAHPLRPRLLHCAYAFRAIV
jgi:hypothetical protein